ncbi:MAG: IclR family transcriptional regulator [Alphaproteobacteria bacterium]|nr:IclR family transcriptional regulator [Alphaproteobacteria bacterium]
MTKTQQGVRSVEIGLTLVERLVHSHRGLSLKDLAQAAAMSPAKAHRYLVSLRRARLVSQAPESGRYGLGPLAVSLGLAALGNVDLYRLAGEELSRLCEATGATVVQAIWGEGAALVARVEQPNRPITVNVRAGAVLPILTSASGRLFAAFLPNAVVGPLIEREFQRAEAPTYMGKRLDHRAFQALLDDIRSRQLARTEGDLTTGIGALSGPVFDHSGAMAMALAMVGPTGTLDLQWSGQNARALRTACEALSEQLGYRVPDRAPSAVVAAQVNLRKAKTMGGLP